MENCAYLRKNPGYAPGNRPYRPVNEPKAVVQWSSFGCYSINIRLEVNRTKNFMIPVQYLMSMSIINVVNHVVINHTQNWHGFSKPMNHISISTRLRHSL